MKYGAEPDCGCGRGHNRFGWFWSPELERIHDEHLKTKIAAEEPEELVPVMTLAELFEARLEKK